MTDLKLEDCPFCGGDNLAVITGGAPFGYSRSVICDDCFARGPAVRPGQGDRVSDINGAAAEAWDDQWALVRLAAQRLDQNTE